MIKIKSEITASIVAPNVQVKSYPNPSPEEMCRAIVDFRWSRKTLYVSWKAISDHFKRKFGFDINQREQLGWRRTKIYQLEAFYYVNNHFGEIERRAKEYKKSPVEYAAYSLGVDIDIMRKHFVERSIQLPTSFKYHDGGRAKSQLRKSNNAGYGDCAIRCLVAMSGWSYDEVFTKLKYFDHDPTRGTFTHSIVAFASNCGYRSVHCHFFHDINLHNLLLILPQLSDVSMIVFVPRHVYFVKEGEVQDTGDCSFKNIEGLMVEDSDHDMVSSAIFNRLSLNAYVKDLLELKRESPGRTWTSIADEMHISVYYIEKLRRTQLFYDSLRSQTELVWALS